MAIHRRLTSLLRLAASAAAVAIGMATAAHAQVRLDSLVTDPQQKQFGAYVHTVCSNLAGRGFTNSAPAGAAADAQDLYNRCNGAIKVANGQTGTDPAAILNQYAGLQKNAQQSDAVVLDGRLDTAVAGRLGAVSRTTRAAQVAGLMSSKPILLASNDEQDAGMAAQSAVRERGFDAYVTGGYATGEQDSTNRELGFDYDAFFGMAGVDYLASGGTILGAAVTYSESSADFDQSSALALANPGDMDTSTWSVAAYGMLHPTERLEISGLIGYGSSEYETTRAISVIDPNVGGTVNRTANGDTEGDAWQGSVNGFYELLQGGPGSLGVIFGASYYNGTIEGYTEAGAQGLNLSYGQQDVESLQVSLGLSASRAVSTSFGVVTPHVRARYLLETQDDIQTVAVRYAAADPSTGSFTIASNPSDESSFELAGGVSAIWANGVMGFAEAQTIIGLENVTHYGLSAGVRFEF